MTLVRSGNVAISKYGQCRVDVISTSTIALYFCAEAMT